MEVKETTKYERLVGVKEKPEEEIKESSLADFIPELNTDNSEDKEWKKLWVGMPEFNQKDNPSYKTIYVHFRNKEDFDKFCALYKQSVDTDQTITPKTKSMWFPHLNREENALLRWIEDDNK